MALESKPENSSLFVSWSKEGKAIANQFKDWIEDVLSTIIVFCSDQDIEKGERAVSAIFDRLDECSIGVIVITPNTSSSQWIHFEAGALSKGPGSRVMPLLVGMATNQLTGPLNQLQATEANNREAMWALVQAINKQTAEIDSNRLSRQFERLWPEWQGFVESLQLSTKTSAEVTTDPVENRLDRVLQALDKINSYLFGADDIDEIRDRISRKRGNAKFTGAHLLALKPGELVRHIRYGDGTVVEIAETGDKQLAVVSFADFGNKEFLLAFTPLERASALLPPPADTDL
jgi:hypothetical protein